MLDAVRLGWKGEGLGLGGSRQRNASTFATNPSPSLPNLAFGSLRQRALSHSGEGASRRPGEYLSGEGPEGIASFTPAAIHDHRYPGSTPGTPVASIICRQRSR